jgi:hypothetical protein
MAEDNPDNNKNPMKEAINLLRDNHSAKSKRNDNSLLRYIVGLFVLIIEGKASEKEPGAVCSTCHRLLPSRCA